jgi:hypothetical protein
LEAWRQRGVISGSTVVESAAVMAAAAAAACRQRGSGSGGGQGVGSWQRDSGGHGRGSHRAPPQGIVPTMGGVAALFLSALLPI